MHCMWNSPVIFIQFALKAVLSRFPISIASPPTSRPDPARVQKKKQKKHLSFFLMKVNVSPSLNHPRNCELKKGSSYVWQSIWAGIQTFKKGCIWRVGDGTKINIWNDCWIPNSASKKIITIRGNQVLTKVCELLDPIIGDWDEQLIRENFWHIDAECILQIPIFHVETEDFVAWHLTKNGVLTINSGRKTSIRTIWA